MHPLLAASLINSFSTERVAGAKKRRAAKAAKTPGSDHSEPGEVIIRRASVSDAPALVRLSSPHTS